MHLSFYLYVLSIFIYNDNKIIKAPWLYYTLTLRQENKWGSVSMRDRKQSAAKAMTRRGAETCASV